MDCARQHHRHRLETHSTITIKRFPHKVIVINQNLVFVSCNLSFTYIRVFSPPRTIIILDFSFASSQVCWLTSTLSTSANMRPRGRENRGGFHVFERLTQSDFLLNHKTEENPGHLLAIAHFKSHSLSAKGKKKCFYDSKKRNFSR